MYLQAQRVAQAVWAESTRHTGCNGLFGRAAEKVVSDQCLGQVVVHLLMQIDKADSGCNGVDDAVLDRSNSLDQLGKGGGRVGSGMGTGQVGAVAPVAVPGIDQQAIVILRGINVIMLVVQDARRSEERRVGKE